MLKVIGSQSILSDLGVGIQSVIIKFILWIELTFLVLLKPSEEEYMCLRVEIP